MRFKDKPKIIFFMILFSLILLALSNYGNASIDVNYFNETGSISGKVSAPDSETTIYLLIQDHSLPSKFKIISSTDIDTDGSFFLTNISMGIYDLVIISNNDYINRSLHFIGVKGRETTQLGEIYLAKVGETGSVSGSINPIIENTVVKIKKFGESEIDAYDVVEEDGSYKFTGLSPDIYSIFVDFDESSEFRNYKWGMIEIQANKSIENINLVFTPKTSWEYVDRILIKFDESTSEEEKSDIIKSNNCLLMSHRSFSTLYVISIPQNKTVEEMIGIFKNEPKVTYANPNGISVIFGIEKKSEESKNDTYLTDFDKIIEFISRIKKKSHTNDIVTVEKDVDINEKQDNILIKIIQFIRDFLRK